MDRKTKKFDLVSLKSKSARSIQKAMHKRYHIDDPMLKDFDWKQITDDKLKSTKLNEDASHRQNRLDMKNYIKKYYKDKRKSRY